MSITIGRDERRPAVPLPLTLNWNRQDPLPKRAIRGSRDGLIFGMEVPPWLDSGPVDRPFDFCSHMQRLCASIVERCYELAHIDVSRLLFAVTQARSLRSHGLQARVTPLRFRRGSLLRRRRGVTYQVQRFFVDGYEMLYLVAFCLPRFLDLSFDEKFVTIFHELYHISPAFDGDLRRHEGRYSIHSHSQKVYDQHMAALARAYLTDGADPALHHFLRLDFGQLQARHGRIVGAVVPRPKLIPLCPV